MKYNAKILLYQLTEVLKISQHICTFVAPAFQTSFHSETFWSFRLFFCFSFMKSKCCLPKLMLLNFGCQKTSFLYKRNFVVMDEKYTL